MEVESFVRQEEPPGSSHPTALKLDLNGPEVNTTQHKLATNVAFANGLVLTPDCLNADLILVTGLFLLAINSTTLVTSVELNGTLLPAPSIGLLRRLMLRMLARRTSIVVASAPALSRIRAVFVPSGV
jgi:hypothetical protein